MDSTMKRIHHIPELPYSIEHERRLMLRSSFPWMLSKLQYKHGWDILVYQMLGVIQIKVEDLGIETRSIHIQHIKEKWGALSVQGYWPDEVDPIVEAAQARSEYVCEECGSDGQLWVGLGEWWYTRCTRHIKADSVPVE